MVGEVTLALSPDEVRDLYAEIVERAAGGRRPGRRRSRRS
jgi:hypothetical protein